MTKCEMYLNLDIKKKRSEGHWAQRYIRNKQNEEKIRKYWWIIDPKPKSPCTVTLERIYNYHVNEKPFDDDNLMLAFKGVRDTIADLLIPGLAAGRADESGRGIKFVYIQTRDEISRVRITIEEDI